MVMFLEERKMQGIREKKKGKQQRSKEETKGRGETREGCQESQSKSSETKTVSGFRSRNRSAAESITHIKHPCVPSV